MPRIIFKGAESTGGGNWTPLPRGTYEMEVEAVDETVSSNNNPQLKVSTFVCAGEYEGRKVVHWFPLVDAAGWKLRSFAEATIPDKVEYEDSGEVDKDGRPISKIDMDTDDLIGTRFFADATTKNDNNGNPQNNWLNFRGSLDGEAAADEPADEESEAPPAQAAPRRGAAPAPKGPPATQTRAAAQPARTAAAPARNTQPTRGAAAPATRDRRRLNG